MNIAPVMTIVTLLHLNYSDSLTLVYACSTVSAKIISYRFMASAGPSAKKAPEGRSATMKSSTMKSSTSMRSGDEGSQHDAESPRDSDVEGAGTPNSRGSRQ